MIKLYYHPQTRATRVRYLMEELGVGFDLIEVDFPGGAHTTAAFKSINPLQQLPAIKDAETTMFESVAICLHLADKYRDRGLAPALDHPERGPYLQWCVAISGSLEPALMEAWRANQGIEASGMAVGLPVLLDAVESTLDGRQTLLRSGFSTADVLWGLTLHWIKSVPGVSLQPALTAYTKSVMSRPAAVRVFGGSA